MHYCCWPCVCDVQDFVKVDTVAVTTRNGEAKMHFAVIGEDDNIAREKTATPSPVPRAPCPVPRAQPLDTHAAVAR